jgi:hypothetical protein
VLGLLVKIGERSRGDRPPKISEVAARAEYRIICQQRFRRVECYHPLGQQAALSFSGCSRI